MSSTTSTILAAQIIAPLLAVHELGRDLAFVARMELGAALLVGGLPDRAAEQRMELVGDPDRHSSGRRRWTSVDAGLRVPLLVLALLVQRGSNRARPSSYSQVNFDSVELGTAHE